MSYTSMAKVRQKLKSKPQKRRTKTVTEDDIDMLLELAELYNTAYDFEAAEWFRGNIKEKQHHLKNLDTSILGEAKAPNSERYTSKFELAEILIEYEFLDENLYFDRYGGVQTEWEGTKSIIYGIRKEWNDPRFRENFKLLARKGSKWLESHPPKIKEQIE